MDAKRPALGFSRPTDNFCSVAWRESTVWWMPAIVPTTRSKLAGEIPSRCATRARSSVEQCSTPRPSVCPCSGSVGGAAAQAAQQSSPCCAEDRIQSKIHRRYPVGSPKRRALRCAAQHAALRLSFAALHGGPGVTLGTHTTLQTRETLQCARRVSAGKGASMRRAAMHSQLIACIRRAMTGTTAPHRDSWTRFRPCMQPRVPSVWTQKV